MSEPDDIPDSILAARYALGVAELAEIAHAETRMATDADFAARVAFYEAALYALEPGADAVDLPEDSWDRIAAAISDGNASADTRPVPLDTLAWEPFIPGVDRKVVSVDKVAATQVALYRVAPGAMLAGHLHCVTEECMVLDGAIEVDGIALPAGDLHLAFSDTRPGPLTSRTGALVYVRADLPTRM